MTTFSPKKLERYNVRWDCPHCGNSHNWWWEDEFEAHDDGVCDMICDRCMEPSKCEGDGTGFYVAIKYEAPEPKPPIEQRVADLESLEEDLHNYVRGLEDKVNTNNQLAFDAINTATMRLRELEARAAANHKQSFDAINRLSKRLIKLETSVSDYRRELDNLGRGRPRPSSPCGASRTASRCPALPGLARSTSSWRRRWSGTSTGPRRWATSTSTTPTRR